jgi:hypothetical protein
MSKYPSEIEHAWLHHTDEHLHHEQDFDHYDYRSFKVGLVDVIRTWVFSACIIVLWLVAF